MQCPDCSGTLEVKDSRPTLYDGEPSVRRRRVCDVCRKRITTYEIADNGEANQRRDISDVINHARHLRDTLSELISGYDAANEGGGS